MTGVDPKPITIIMEPSLLARYVHAVGRAPQRLLHAGSHATAAPRSQSFPVRTPSVPRSSDVRHADANAVRAAVWKFVIGHEGGALCGCHGHKNCRKFSGESTSAACAMCTEDWGRRIDAPHGSNHTSAHHMMWGDHPMTSDHYGATDNRHSGGSVGRTVAGVVQSVSGMLLVCLYFAVPVGWLYWVWLSIQLGSFMMFFLGMAGPFGLLVAPIGLYALLFGVPIWVLRLFA